MKLSELIKELQINLNTYGDINVTGRYNETIYNEFDICMYEDDNEKETLNIELIETKEIECDGMCYKLTNAILPATDIEEIKNRTADDIIVRVYLNNAPSTYHQNKAIEFEDELDNPWYAEDCFYLESVISNENGKYIFESDWILFYVRDNEDKLEFGVQDLDDDSIKLIREFVYKEIPIIKELFD